MCLPIKLNFEGHFKKCSINHLIFKIFFLYLVKGKGPSPSLKLSFFAFALGQKIKTKDNLKALVILCLFIK